MKKLVKEIVDCLPQIEKDHEATWHFKTGRYGENNWAIVFANYDYDDDGKEVLLGKVAFQPRNSMLQCDYLWDWQMSIDKETGEVDDTEIILGHNDVAGVEWLVEQWERIEKELKAVEEAA